jgi:S1-C subfamily serine protease
MSFFVLPKFKMVKFKFPKFKAPFLKVKRTKLKDQSLRSQIFRIALFTFIFSTIFGLVAGFVGGGFLLQYKGFLSGNSNTVERIIEKEYLPQTSQEQAVIDVVNEASPAVVSIIITKDLPVFEQYYLSPFDEFFNNAQYRQTGTEKQEIGSGSGFIVSEDGMVLTNKHVVLDEEADYTVLTNDGHKFSARVLARDPLQDLAILKIETEKNINENGGLTQKPFSIVRLGDSDKLQSGQTVVAIGNALGEYRNTISVGVVSGLGRTITASSGSLVETIEDVIQTDAAINQGNSGGPLLNLKGEVVGINTATVLGAQSIGFAIPINKATRDIKQIKASGKIVYPYLGVYYILITEKMQKDFDLSVDYGVWVGRSQNGTKTPTAVIKGTPAEEAGLQRDDIILEFDGQKITSESTLGKIIQKYSPGDIVNIKILRDKVEMILSVTLGEREE